MVALRCSLSLFLESIHKQMSHTKHIWIEQTLITSRTNKWLSLKLNCYVQHFLVFRWMLTSHQSMRASKVFPFFCNPNRDFRSRFQLQMDIQLKKLLFFATLTMIVYSFQVLFLTFERTMMNVYIQMLFFCVLTLW